MKKLAIILFAALSFATIDANAQEPFIGEIRMFAGNFAPRGWAFCDGQLMSISQNTALFSLLGTLYGGDGRTTFGLPDLRGRAPIHSGSGPGLNKVIQGQKSGGYKTINTNRSSDEGTTVIYEQPTTSVRYIIALIGTYPSRS